MKRKLISVIITVSFSIFVIGCSSSDAPAQNSTTEQQSNDQVEEFYENSYNVNYLPLTLEYNEGEIVLEEFAAVNTEIDYANCAGAAFVFDLSGVSDKDRHYLIEQNDFENDLMTSVLVDGDTDDDDSESLSILDSSYKDGKYYILYGSDESDYERESLAGRKVTAFIELRQNDKDEYKSYLYETEILESDSSSSTSSVN